MQWALKLLQALVLGKPDSSGRQDRVGWYHPPLRDQPGDKIQVGIRKIGISLYSQTAAVNCIVVSTLPAVEIPQLVMTAGSFPVP